MKVIGCSMPRKDARDKVTGRAKYNHDITVGGTLYAVPRLAEYAHAAIKNIRTVAALKVEGVRAVLTGQDAPFLVGEVLEDRPPLAHGRVLYWGEPVALVVADSEEKARLAASLIDIDYEPLPVVNSIDEALKPNAPLIHPDVDRYTILNHPVYPKSHTNIADHVHVRKGPTDPLWPQCDVVIESRSVLPQIDHMAMETRSATVEILPGGRVLVHSTTQAPFAVQKMLAHYFQLDQGQVVVMAPLVGGAFGGKAAVQLEILAYLASRAVGGQMVSVVNSREQDFAMSPVGTGLDAHFRLGARDDGKILAAEITYRLDIGAYTDSAPRIARAIAAQCTGPYAVDNVKCDVLCVYTNHTYTTAFRGFGHMPMTFAIERAIEKLADALKMDSLALRLMNAIGPGQSSPTKARLTASNVGDLPKALNAMAKLIEWNGGKVMKVGPHLIRVQGIASFWKTSSSPPDAVSGAVITMNKDGTVNLSIGAVECGPGTKTTAAQILAEKLQMPVDRVFVRLDVNTEVDPEHWKTVASLSTYMVGKAVEEACKDLIRQLKNLAAIALKCSPSDLAVAGEKVFLRDDPQVMVRFSDIAHGYRFPEGDTIGGQRIARGSFVIRHLNLLDEETGEGRPGPGWTVGVQGVLLEVNTETFDYRVVKAASVIDAGKVLNPQGAKSVVMGGMCQGLSYATRESVVYSSDGTFLNRQMRSYRTVRMGEQPEQYLVEFVETPQIDAPFGARPLGEHGVLAMPAAVANALSRALGIEANQPPFVPESLWALAGGEKA